MNALLNAAKEAAMLLHRIQDATEGPMQYPWPEIEALEEAIAEAEQPHAAYDAVLESMDPRIVGAASALIPSPALP